MLPALGAAVKVPTACAAVALVVRFNVFDPLVTEIVGAVLEVGGPETVPVAVDCVALFVRVNVFGPLVT